MEQAKVFLLALALAGFVALGCGQCVDTLQGTLSFTGLGTFDNCPDLKDFGLCSGFGTASVQAACQKTCGICTPEPSSPPPPPVCADVLGDIVVPVDAIADIPFLLESFVPDEIVVPLQCAPALCIFDLIKQKCPITCGLCGTDAIFDGPCVDNASFISSTFQAGCNNLFPFPDVACQVDASIRANCPKTCGVCVPDEGALEPPSPPPGECADSPFSIEKALLEEELNKLGELGALFLPYLDALPDDVIDCTDFVNQCGSEIIQTLCPDTCGLCQDVPTIPDTCEDFITEIEVPVDALFVGGQTLPGCPAYTSFCFLDIYATFCPESCEICFGGSGLSFATCEDRLEIPIPPVDVTSDDVNLILDLVNVELPDILDFLGGDAIIASFAESIIPDEIDCQYVADLGFCDFTVVLGFPLCPITCSTGCVDPSPPPPLEPPSPSPLSPELPTAFADVNFDGQTTISDVILIIDSVTGDPGSLSPAQFEAADVNQNGVVNVQDIILVIEVIVNGA